MTSSKKLSNSSGNAWERIKNFSNNNKNNNPPTLNFPLNNQNQTGRKLLEDFNKFPMNKIVENEANNQNNNNISFSFGVSNNNFSFLTPENKIKKENENEKVAEKKTEIIKTNKILINDNITTTNNNHNMFFTDYGDGYKCNCQKTQCNKYYCQCFRENRYCFNCNCTGCNNQKPEFFASNKHQGEEENKDKKNIPISCTCTKSGCNKNYCECYKNKVKCNDLCRCRNCENCEEGKFDKNVLNILNYECCLANSVFIIKNKIVVEDISKKKIKKNFPIKREIKITISENLLSSLSDENESIGNKRKRQSNNDMDSEKFSNSNKKSKLSDEYTDEATKKKKNYIEGDLFDKDGKLILTNFKL